MKFLFYKPIKIDTLAKNVCFWSDTHFGHKCEHWDNPLWRMRGFDSVEDHDEQLVSRWNTKCNSDSVVFHLGDFIFGQNAEERFMKFLDRLNFNTLYVMPGNHNSGWRQAFERQAKNVLYLNNSKSVYFIPNYIEVIANEQPIVLSHYPLASFNGQARGSWMIHGHCHSNLYKKEIGSILYKAKIFDIGIENSPYPKTFEDLKIMFDQKDIITFDHHDQHTQSPF